MSDTVQNAERDFWTPPVAPPAITIEPSAASLAMVEACDKCATEFIPGAKFCHVCGAARTTQATSVWAAWTHRAIDAVRNLEFEHMERWVVSARQTLGLSLGALIAFAIGLFCVVGAIFVGLIFTVQTTLDWQAVQVWRIEWLLGASASFLAGILLKRSQN